MALFEAEAHVAGALRGGTYNTATGTFFCHCPKPAEFKIPQKFVKLLNPIINKDEEE